MIKVADLYELSAFDTVTIELINGRSTSGSEALDAFSADYVNVTIRDQFVSRGEMFLFQDTLKGKWIHEGQRLDQNNQVRTDQKRC